MIYSQLRAIIDDNQDAGTFYGLNSKLILRDIQNPSERGIAVTIGPMEAARQYGHVRVRTSHTNQYVRFSINTTLNRLDCPPEPLAVYTKALCHALTSFVVADPLTGRTGVEEALHCLSSGIAQPWAPPSITAYSLLSNIAGLTPQRTYYPGDLRVQQKVLWSDKLPFSTQHDDFRHYIDRILRQCTQLCRFVVGGVEAPADATKNEIHLLQRARLRNGLYRRVGMDCETHLPDVDYTARDQGYSTSRENALEAAKLIRTDSANIIVSRDLADSMQAWPVIYGLQEHQEAAPRLLAELTRLDLSAHWGSLYRHCQKLHKSRDLYAAMYFFAAICFRPDADMVMIRTLIAFAIMEQFQTISFPKWDSFTNFRKGQQPLLINLMQVLVTAVRPYPSDARSTLGLALHGKQRRQLESAQFKYDELTTESRRAFARDLIEQWPCQNPTMPGGLYENLDVKHAMSLVQADWLRLYKNYELGVHLQKVQGVLDMCLSHNEWAFVQTTTFERTQLPRVMHRRGFPDQSDAFRMIKKAHQERQDPNLRYHLSGAGGAPDILQMQDIEPASISDQLLVKSEALQSRSSRETPNYRPEVEQLRHIIHPLASGENTVRRIYGEQLMQSILSLQKLESRGEPDEIRVDPRRLSDAITSTRNALRLQYKMIIQIFSPLSYAKWLLLGDLWPSLTPITILETLSSSSSFPLKRLFLKIIAVYGQLITMLQRMLRIERALKNGTYAQLQAEVENRGHIGWRPEDYPDWLLLEIEGNILIREDQYQVAMAMIRPESGRNSVLQMNMGQGKSSVILPMISAVLAEKSQLMRVIVPKPLLLQMAQLFQARLGGLVGRSIKHFPWSRKSSTTIENVRAYKEVHQQMLQEQGVILALPEHLLSFKLSGLQLLSSGRLEEAKAMIETESWLTSHFRDVLDECDFTLAVKTQLVYPAGSQTLVDGHPVRWKTVQSVLRLVRDQARILQRSNPRGIQVVERLKGSGFPMIHFSQDALKDALIENVTKAIMSGEGDILPVRDSTDRELEDAAIFIGKAHITKERLLDLNMVYKNKHGSRQDLLLLRGLLVHRILLMGLTKRWNVQYGLHARRDPVAVPFQAKGYVSNQQLRRYFPTYSQQRTFGTSRIWAPRCGNPLDVLELLSYWSSLRAVRPGTQKHSDV